MALGKNDEARKEFEKIRSQDAGVPELPWNSELIDLFMIRSLLEAGEWKEAAGACRDWLRTRDDRPIIRAFYAEALRNLSDYKAAHNHLLRALDKEPRELEFWYADILVSWEGKDFKSLKKALKAAKSLGGDPGIVRRFEVLLTINGVGDAKDKITILQKAIRDLGPEPELMYALGEAYIGIGFLEESISWFKKTISIKSSHEKAWLGEIAAVEALLDEKSGRGLLKSAENKLTASEQLGKLYNAYLSKWPDNLSIRRERAMHLVRTFEYNEAAAELEKLLVWEPSNPSLRRVLAYSYRKTGRYRESAVFLKSLLKEKPDDISLLIEYSGCLERAGAVDYAVSVLSKARELFRSSAKKKEIADISLALGILKYRQKKTEEAFDYLREAAALDTNDHRAYEWMGIIARKTKRSGDAVYYEKEAQKRKKYRKN